jgi:hypothetical protein
MQSRKTGQLEVNEWEWGQRRRGCRELQEKWGVTHACDQAGPGRQKGMKAGVAVGILIVGYKPHERVPSAIKWVTAVSQQLMLCTDKGI